MKTHHINGHCRKGKSNGSISMDNPTIGKVIDRVPHGNAQDVDSAVQAAKNAFDDWKRVSASDKAELLHEASQKMRAHKHDIIALLTREQGKPLSENGEEDVWTYSTFDYFAGPFGGMKCTGGGRELGEEGLDEFRETKHVHWDIEARPKSWWLPYHK